MRLYYFRSKSYYIDVYLIWHVNIGVVFLRIGDSQLLIQSSSDGLIVAQHSVKVTARLLVDVEK